MSSNISPVTDEGSSGAEAGYVELLISTRLGSYLCSCVLTCFLDRKIYLVSRKRSKGNAVCHVQRQLRSVDG